MSAPVLIAYDGSDDAAHAIACAGRVLAPRRAIVMHSFVGLSRMLLRSNVEVVSGPLAEAAKESDAADAEAAERIVAEGAQLAIAAGFEAQPVVVEQKGKAWETILACADKHEAATIVAGARGQTALASALLGSVSNGLVHHSRRPVLVVPASDEFPAPEAPALLCYDASDDSKHALKQAAQLLAERQALVLHLWQPWVDRAPNLVPAVSGTVGAMARELDEIGESQAAECADQGARLATEAGLHAEALPERSKSTLWRAVIQIASQRNAAVIVLGKRGLSGLSELLGSVSHSVLHHAGRPILIVPRPDAG